MENKKKIIKTTSKELVHWFANRAYDEAYSNNKVYKITKTHFYYNNKCVARFIDDKTVVINQNFNNISSFGNGINSYNIKRAFNNHKVKIYYINTYINETGDFWKYQYISIICDDIISHIIRLKEYITNNHRLRCFSSIDDIINSQKELKKELKKLQIDDKFINRVINFHYNTCISYSGWNPNYVKGEYTSTIKKLCNYKFNKKELEIIKNKKEKYYLYVEKLNFKKEIENEQRRQKREQQLLEYKKRAKDDLQNWINNINTHNNFAVLDKIYLRIKNGYIETTRYASITLEKGEYLFKMYSKCKNTNSPKDFRDKNIKIGFYQLLEINKIDTGEWYVKVGCHTIYDTEIQLFLKHFNLNW